MAEIDWNVPRSVLSPDRHWEAAKLLAGALWDDAGVAMTMGGTPSRIRAERWFVALCRTIVAGGGVLIGIERNGSLAGVLVLNGGGRRSPLGSVLAMGALLWTVGPGSMGRLIRHE